MADELTRVAEDSARGSFFLVTGTAFATIIMAVSSIIVARLLGPESYGQYTLALVVPGMLFLFTDLGINHGIIRYTASLCQEKQVGNIIKIIRYGLVLRALAGTTIFIITYLFSDAFASLLLQRSDLAWFVKIASLSILFQVISTTVASFFVGLDKTEYNALIANIQAITKAITSIVLVILGFNIFGAILGHVISYIISAAIGMLILAIILRDFRQQNLREYSNNPNDGSILKDLVKYGAPIYVALLLTNFIPSYQNMILALFTADINIGNYKAAVNFITLMTVLTAPITTALLPAFSKLNSTENRKLQDFFRLANKYVTLITLPAAFLIISLSKEIIYIIYGSEYQLAPDFLALHSLIYLLTGLGYITLPSLFNGLGETKATLKVSLLAFILVIAISPLLTQKYGVQGAIASLIIANTASTLYGMSISKRRLQVKFDIKTIAKIYMVSAASVIPVFLLTQTINMPKILIVAAGGLIYLFTYATLIPLTRTITAPELKTLASIMWKIKFLFLLIKPILKYEQKILSLKINKGFI